MMSVVEVLSIPSSQRVVVALSTWLHHNQSTSSVHGNSSFVVAALQSAGSEAHFHYCSSSHILTQENKHQADNIDFNV